MRREFVIEAHGRSTGLGIQHMCSLEGVMSILGLTLVKKTRTSMLHLKPQKIVHRAKSFKSKVLMKIMDKIVNIRRGVDSEEDIININ